MDSQVLLFCKQAYALCKLASSFVRSFEDEIQRMSAVPDDCSEAEGLRPRDLEWLLLAHGVVTGEHREVGRAQRHPSTNRSGAVAVRDAD
jgi:hypothetical protein